MTDTAKLKAAAERVVEAYGDEWFEAGSQICTVHKSKVNLINLCNPAAVLELIAALESQAEEFKRSVRRESSARARIDELHADCREKDARIAELESQRQMAFSACNRWADKCREAQKRVAELEARKVKLPSINPQMFNDDVMFGYRKAQREAIEFCAVAGINLETGGEA